jgi:predicted Rossmann fold nucleotide-binding protein DprA/Smf involved in DNA uptake
LRPFLRRNRDIVDACQLLIVAPGEEAERRRSGTWATYRYARTVGRALLVVFPDGRTEGA